MRSERRGSRFAAGRRRRLGVLVLTAGAALASAAPAAAQATVETGAPEVRFHLGGDELLPIAYPERYGSRASLEEDVEWVRENSDALRAWWAEEGPTYLRRVTDLAGLPWPYSGIDVYLVRHWPVVSIEHPLVLALEAVRSSSGQLELPDDDDLRILLLAHQVVHYLLDDPGFLPRSRRAAAYDHPFLRPGDFALEAMVNWLTYEALEDVWGRDRLRRATAEELWRGFNPNHAFVTGELMERWSLSRMRPLAEWLAAHPEGSEVLDIAERYRSEAVSAGRAVEEREIPREDRTGTEYGVDLGATFDGEVFVAYVDEGSAAARAGLLQGDVLATIEGRPVDDVVEAQRRMNESWSRNEEINLSVRRGEREVFVTIEG
ncbi:MAG: PDZ domain-containing protein [Gemmatimonadetes bacterium]|nr:PDZ domain-containing protein [Gemmatimonadota bacterium]